MFPALLLAIAPLPMPEDLRAADRFMVGHGCAIQNARLAHDHPALMQDEVMTWNDTMAYRRWVAECRWRAECWNALAAAMDGEVVTTFYVPTESQLEYVETVTVETGLSNYRRRWHLARLRELLGDEDFDAGRMPGPLPTYRR